MTELETFAKKFWSAAHFVRRAPERDQTMSVRILCQVASRATGKVKSRATNLLVELDEQSTEND